MSSPVILLREIAGHYAGIPLRELLDGGTVRYGVVVRVHWGGGAPRAAVLLSSKLVRSSSKCVAVVSRPCSRVFLVAAKCFD